VGGVQVGGGRGTYLSWVILGLAACLQCGEGAVAASQDRGGDERCTDHDGQWFLVDEVGEVGEVEAVSG